MHAGLPFHPFADLFPLMEGEEYAALVADIKAHGLRDPAVTFEAALLDGRNRQRACLEANVPLQTRPFVLGEDGDDALAFVISRNLHRRHLNESQRAMVAAKLETMKHGGARRGVQDANLHLDRADAAQRLNVSTRTVASAHKVITQAEPEIIAAVQKGTMKVSAAASVAGKPRSKQLNRLARDERKAEGTQRQTDDFYRTPVSATAALLRVEEFPARIWEPACGDGAISNALIDEGYDVVSTDLIDRGFGTGNVDFLTEKKPRVGCIITNPPFKLDDEFARHALDIGVRKIALLCRLSWLEGAERFERLFSRNKLARIWVFSSRQTLWHGDDEEPETDGGMTAYAWFVFDKDHKGLPTLGWI